MQTQNFSIYAFRVLFLVLFNLPVNSQNKTEPYSCGTEILHKELLQNDKQYKKAYEGSKKNNSELNTSSYKKALSINTIPIVVHVVEYNGDALITDAEIMEHIYNRLNGAFNGTTGFGVDTDIQFCMAQRTPEGYPTNGINRINGNNIPGYEGVVPIAGQMKTVVSSGTIWPITDYINIWIVGDILGAAGFAYYPLNNPDSTLDGVFIQSTSIIGTSIIVHELGHSFNLKHTESSDDEVCDTPPHNSECEPDPDFPLECPSGYPVEWDNSFRNYMVTSCPNQTSNDRDRFTFGQRDRMLLTFENTVRGELLNSNGCDPINVLDAGIVDLNPVCNSEISVNIINLGQEVLTSATIEWKINGLAQTPFNWIGNLNTLEEEQVVIGNTSISPTGINLDIEVVLPNGFIDQDPTNNSISASNVKSGLIAGTYTIGGQTPTFINLTEAVSYINNNGICGPVVFNIRSGIYDEQLIFNEIKGASDINTITFQAEESNESTILTYNSSVFWDYVIKLNGTDYINFNELTIEVTSSPTHLVVIENGASNNAFRDCIFNAYNTYGNIINYTTHTNQFNSNYSFINNTFNNGDVAINFRNNYYIDYDNELIISGNVFNNQNTAIKLKKLAGTIIENNVLETNSEVINSTGINITDASSLLQIKKNRIVGYKFFGINIVGSFFSECLITNNFISINLGPNVDHEAAVKFQTSSNITFIHNSINTYNNNGLNISYETSNVEVKNNSISNKGNGYALNISDRTSNISSNYNNLFSEGSLGLVKFDEDIYLNLEQWQEGSEGLDANSVSGDPEYFSDTDLHSLSLLLDRNATPIAINTDIDEEQRNVSTPDIGADEFVLALEPAFSFENCILNNQSIVPQGDNINAVFWSLTNLETEATHAFTTPSANVSYLPNGAYEVCMTVYINNYSYSDSLCETITIDCGVSECDSFNELKPENLYVNYDTSTLHWDPIPGAVNYRVGLTKKPISYCGCQDYMQPFSFYTEDPEFELPLFYQSKCFPWVVLAFCEDGTITKVSDPACYGQFMMSNCSQNMKLTSESDKCKKEESIKNMIIYPNPTSNWTVIKVNSDTVQKVTIEVLNIKGRVLFSKEEVAKKGENNWDIDLSRLISGVYYIKINEVIYYSALLKK